MTATVPPGPRAPRALQTARWIARPAAMMGDCARRYGDMFTLRIANEGTWVFVTDPEAVKQIFTGDPRLLHAGEANVVLLPVLGSHSVLLLDEGAHMAQRKLMLPPFHGERMRGYEQTMAQVAARELERWPAGERLSTWPTMQAITLEVIMRTVFGVTDSARLRRLGDVLRSSLSWATDPRRLARLAMLGPRRIAEQGTLKRALQPTDELIFASGRASPSSRSRSCCASWWPGSTSGRPGRAPSGACAARSCSPRSEAASWWWSGARERIEKGARSPLSRAVAASALAVLRASGLPCGRSAGLAPGARRASRARPGAPA